MKTNVSGHSGLPEAVELEQMARRSEERKAKTIHRYKTLLSTMDRLGIAPHERQTFFIQFMKWVKKETEENK